MSKEPVSKVRVREREREADLATTGDVILHHRGKFIEKQLTGTVVIRERDREYEQTKQSLSKFYLEPHKFLDNALQDWQVFKHDIRKNSGKHKHQGGLVIFCLEGKGYSIVDGVRHEWKEGDVLLLPVKPGGVEHQHFNADPGTPCKWIAFTYIPYWDMLASTMSQLQFSPDYKPR